MNRAMRAVTLAALASLALPSAAQEDRDLSAPTAAIWLTSQTEANLEARRQQGWRITDLEIQSTSPLLFRAALVANSGVFQRTWYWYPNLSAGEMAAKILLHKARFTDIEPFVVNGEARYAGVMVDNQGNNYKQAWFFLSTSAAALAQHVQDNGSRVYDLDSFVIDNVRYYSGLTVKNTGVDARAWWWYFGVTTSQLEQLLAQNQARPVDIERIGTGIYDVVMHAKGNTVAAHYYGRSGAEVNELLAQNQARIVDLEAYSTQFGTVFDVVMINSGNALEARVGNMMRTTSDGWSGAYLKRANGSVLAGINRDRVFEPASLLKTLHHVHAMKQVAQGAISLSQTFTFFAGASGESCPSNVNQVTETLSQVLAGMMMASSNSRTRVVTDRFGMPAINATADQLGMSKTELLHHIGCAGSPNQLTLTDIGRLHEAVINGFLGDQREAFYTLMRTDYYGSGYAEGRLQGVLDSEAAAVGLTTGQFGSFRNAMRVVGKKGGYGTATGFHRTWGAYVALPFYTDAGRETREYVTGAFVGEASNEANAIDAAANGAAEILRDEIRAAMLTWKNHVAGSTSIYGVGCRNSQNAYPTHSIGSTGEPNVSTPINFQMTRAPAQALCVLIFGASKTNWQGIPLPFDLTVIGMPTCKLYAGMDLTIPAFADGLGRVDMGTAIPLNRALVGQSTFSQFAALDAAANTAGVITTNGIEMVIGGQR